MEACGRRYVMDFVESEWRDRQNALALQFYLTDALAAIAENTQHFAGGKAMRKRYADIVESAKPRVNPIDKYSGDEVMAEAVRRLSAAGLKPKAD